LLLNLLKNIATQKYKEHDWIMAGYVKFIFSFINCDWACSVSVVVRMQNWHASGCRSNSESLVRSKVYLVKDLNF